MEGQKEFILRTLKLISVIILYYIIGSKSIFLYVLSLSLYKIFLSCFSNISVKESLKKITNKRKLLNLVLLLIIVTSFLFLLLSILIGDFVSIALKLNNISLVFIFMGLSIITKPLIKLLSEYLEVTCNNLNYQKITIIYDISDNLLLLVISLFTFRIFKMKLITATALLYLSKIFSALLIIILLYLITNNKKITKTSFEDKVNYQKELRLIVKKNSYKSIIRIVKNSFYYISIIILYLVLSTRYNYDSQEIEKIIVFVYFYAIEVINYLIYLAKQITNELPKEANVTDRLYHSLKIMLTITIIFGIISPLTCKVIFNNPNLSIYLVMVNFMAIFILLYDTTFENIKNSLVIYTSLIAGLLVKVITIIPLINSFYRMGYNLVYGDILSTSISMLLSTIINYIYLRNTNKTKGNYFDKILDILFDGILLAIILMLLQFIIPINTDSYFKSLGLIIVYLFVSITFVKIKKKKRG